MSDSVRTADFVGRADELAAFGLAVASARAGVPAVLLVAGEAGIGKSTLVGEAVRRDSAALIVGRCLPMAGEVIPLAPLGELVRDAGRQQKAKVDHIPSLAALRDRVAKGLLGGTQAGAVFAELLALIAVLGGDDVIVVAFEDLHWADPLTWDLFDYLARNLVDEHVVLVGTHRAREVTAHPDQRRRVGELLRLPATRRTLLEGLRREEVAAKIEALTGNVARDEFVDEIVDRAQGNPFFTAEFVAARRAGQAIPAVLSDLIASEFDAHDDTVRRLAEALAVVGRDVEHDLLARVVELDADALEAASRTAIDAQLIVADRDRESYRFRHGLIGEVVYDELLPPARRRLHQRVADALTADATDEVVRADVASELAFHLDRAGDRAAAFVALLRAADIAETLAPAAALRHLERALALWDTVGDAAATEDRGERLWQAAELTSGAVGNAAAARVAREALSHGDPALGAAWGHERLGRYLWGAGDIDASVAEFSTAAALLTDDDGPDAARVFAGLGQAELMLGRYEVAERWSQRVFASLTAPEADRSAWSMARRVLGISVAHSSDPNRGVALCREAVDVAPNAQNRLLAVLYLGVALLDAGQYQDAVNAMLDAAAEARLTGLDRSFGGYVDALAVEGLLRLGRWSEAERVLALSGGAEAFPLGRMRLAVAGAMLAAYRGDRDRAATLLADAAALPVDPLHRWFRDRAAAECHAALGNWTELDAIAKHALDNTAPALWRARFTMYGAIARVELALDARARREVVDTDVTAADILASVEAAREADPGIDAAAHLAHASATVTRLGAPDPGAWAEAAERWSALADPYWLATARLREAEAAAATSDVVRAADMLRESHDVATGLGAPNLVAEIEALSRRTRLSVDAPRAVVMDETSIDRLGLTPREAEVLSLVAAGRTNRQIGEALFVSEKTASVHVSNILRKLGVTSRVDAAAIAQRVGIT